MRRGDQLPHFSITTIDGDRVDYADLWQHKNLLLVTVPQDGSDTAYVSELRRNRDLLAAHDTVSVVTAKSVAGLPPFSVLIADRWGEIQFIAAGQPVRALPTPAEVLEWIEHVQHQCPECQGEAR